MVPQKRTCVRQQPDLITTDCTERGEHLFLDLHLEWVLLFQQMQLRLLEMIYVVALIKPGYALKVTDLDTIVSYYAGYGY